MTEIRSIPGMLKDVLNPINQALQEISRLSIFKRQNGRAKRINQNKKAAFVCENFDRNFCCIAACVVVN